MAERSCRRLMTSETGVQQSTRYLGAFSCKQRCTVMFHMWLICCGTWSQCRSLYRGDDSECGWMWQEVAVGRDLETVGVNHMSSDSGPSSPHNSVASEAALRLYGVQVSVRCCCWLSGGELSLSHHKLRPLAYPEGGYGGSNPPIESSKKICIVCMQNIRSKPCQNFIQENVWKMYANFTLCFSFWGTASLRLRTGALSLDHTGGLSSPDPLARPVTTWTPSIVKSWVRLWLSPLVIIQ